MLSAAESELQAVVKAASHGLGVRSMAEIVCGPTLHLLVASATMGLVKRRGQGRLDMQSPWMQEAYKPGRSRRLDDEATVGKENGAADKKSWAVSSWGSTWSEKGPVARDWRTCSGAQNPA